MNELMMLDIYTYHWLKITFIEAKEWMNERMNEWMHDARHTDKPLAGDYLHRGQGRN